MYKLVTLGRSYEAVAHGVMKRYMSSIYSKDYHFFSRLKSLSLVDPGKGGGMEAEVAYEIINY